MTRHLLLLAAILLSINCKARKVDGNIDFIAPGIYQFAYPAQVIFINFNDVNMSGHKKLFVPADLTEKERYAIVKTLKVQIDLLPEDIIEAYLNIQIIPSRILNSQDFGFYYENQIVIDVEKIRPEISYKEGLKISLMREIGQLIVQRNFRTEATERLRAYFTEFYKQHKNLQQNQDNIYKSGYVTMQAAAIGQEDYSVESEIAEMFAQLMCVESRQKINDFLRFNPESILGEKISHYIKYLEKISPNLNQAYFFNESVHFKEKTTVKINEQDGQQLLASHELRSNETFDFTAIVDEADFEVSTFSIPTEIEDYESPVNNDFSTMNDLEEEQIKTIFNSSPNNKKKTKKTKRKKDGTGLLLIGSLVYLTLELLSQ